MFKVKDASVKNLMILNEITIMHMEERAIAIHLALVEERLIPQVLRSTYHINCVVCIILYFKPKRLKSHL